MSKAEPWSFDIRSGFGAAVGLMQRSAEMMSGILPGHEWNETGNKLECFRLFAWVDQELGFPKSHLQPLDQLAARALKLNDFRSIWALEGVANYYTSACLSAGAGQPMKGMLSTGAGASLPAKTLVSMHAGMGTALSRAILAALGDKPSKAALRDAVTRFFDQCRDNAREGWYESAIEPLGLSVRTMHPHLSRVVSDVIGDIDPAARLLFWHGVGRSLYFVPTNFVSFGSSHERALQTAIREAPGMEERRNAVAGLVWAVTLVNLRNPGVLRNLIRECERIHMPEAVMNGITSALMIWKFMVPGDSSLLSFYSRPAGGNASDAVRWNRFVMRAASKAFAEDFPPLLESGSVSKLFAFGPASKTS